MRSIQTFSLFFPFALFLLLGVVVGSTSASSIEDTFFQSFSNKLKKLSNFGFDEDPNFQEENSKDRPYTSDKVVIDPDGKGFTREVRWKDKDGISHHETITTFHDSYSYSDGDPTKSESKEEKVGEGDGEEEGEKLFRIQKRDEGGNEESKVPEFVVEDGFFDQIDDPMNLF
ncbi:hypothetical protein JCM16303_003509 [Sporobolomyces ruberrimus]